MDTGAVLGVVGDLEIDCDNGTVANLIIYGKQKLFGAFGKEEDICIPWSAIEVIGEETVLVKGAFSYRSAKRKNIL